MCDYSLPVHFFDGDRVTPEKYDIVKVIHHKLMCINEEIDFFMETILSIVTKIRDEGAFQKATPTRYQFNCMGGSFDIVDLGLSPPEDIASVEFDVPLEHWKRTHPESATL